eukprot:13790076-Alexandrium_andersonii.AAC.1
MGPPGGSGVGASPAVLPTAARDSEQHLEATGGSGEDLARAPGGGAPGEPANRPGEHVPIGGDLVGA